MAFDINNPRKYSANTGTTTQGFAGSSFMNNPANNRGAQVPVSQQIDDNENTRTQGLINNMKALRKQRPLTDQEQYDFAKGINATDIYRGMQVNPTSGKPNYSAITGASTQDLSATPFMTNPNGATNSVGVKATSPDSNIKRETPLLPVAQQQNNTNTNTGNTNTANANGGLISSYGALNSDLANRAINGSANLRADQDARTKMTNDYTQQQASRGTVSNPFNFQGSLSDLAGSAYRQNMQTQQQRITDDLTAQGQTLTGLNNATNNAAPVPMTPTQSPYYPIEGKFAGDQTQGERMLKASNLNAIDPLNQDYVRQQANIGGIKNLESKLNSFMGVEKVNPTTFPYVNQFINNVLQKGVGDPSYKTLQNYMSDLTTRYSTYFGAGSQVTNQVRDVANSLLNGQAKKEDIMAVLQSLGTQAEAVQTGTYDQLNSLVNNPSQLGAPQGNTQYSQSTGGSLYDF